MAYKKNSRKNSYSNSSAIATAINNNNSTKKFRPKFGPTKIIPKIGEVLRVGFLTESGEKYREALEKIKSISHNNISDKIMDIMRYNDHIKDNTTGIPTLTDNGLKMLKELSKYPKKD